MVSRHTRKEFENLSKKKKKKFLNSLPSKFSLATTIFSHDGDQVDRKYSCKELGEPYSPKNEFRRVYFCCGHVYSCCLGVKGEMNEGLGRVRNKGEPIIRKLSPFFYRRDDISRVQHKPYSFRVQYV